MDGVAELRAASAIDRTSNPLGTAARVMDSAAASGIKPTSASADANAISNSSIAPRNALSEKASATGVVVTRQSTSRKSMKDRILSEVGLFAGGRPVRR